VKIIQRIRDGKPQYIGKRGKPIKSKSSAMRFKTKSYAKEYLEGMAPGLDPDGWIVIRACANSRFLRIMRYEDATL
jgi:hypothetical protein